MNGTVRATPLQLLIRPVTLSHAGLWECRAVLSGGTTSPSANAGTLTVYSEYTERSIDVTKNNLLVIYELIIHGNDQY